MIALKIEGEKELIAKMLSITEPSSREELLADIGSYGVSSTQQRFLDKKGPDGQSWFHSARAGMAGGQTLRNGNRLFQSLTFTATANAVEWGTNLIYAGIHQFGGIIKAKAGKSLAFMGRNGKMVFVKSVTIPARPYVGVNDDDRAEITQIVEDHIAEKLQ